MDRKSLYSDEVYRGCLLRIEQVKPESRPAWGKMDSAQMLAHCASVIEVFNGKDLGHTPWFMKLMAPVIRNAVFGDRPYPKNSPTAPAYKQVDPKDFAAEKTSLLVSLQAFYEMDKDEAVKIKHPLFGTSTLDERGWAMFKHLDHHLAQFGV